MATKDWESAATRRLVFGIGLLAVVAVVVAVVALLSLAR
jgi:hypothetical protein